MGQLVSKSVLVDTITANLQDYKQLYVEFDDPETNTLKFVPLIEGNVSYTIRTKGGVAENLICYLENDDRLSCNIPLHSADDSDKTFNLSFSSVNPATGYYHLQCFDMSSVVYFQDNSNPSLPFSFPDNIDVWLPDGTEFRNSINKLENSIISLQKISVWKSFAENITKVNDTLGLLSSLLNTIQSSKVIQSSNHHPLANLINVDFSKWVQVHKKTDVDHLSKVLNSNIIVPINEYILFLHHNQKTLIKKQKAFNDCIKHFYTRSASATETIQPLDMKIRFELSRLDYYDYLYQCYIAGLPIRKLYNAFANFLQLPMTKESQFHDQYIPKVNFLRSSIKKAKSFHDLNDLYSNTGEFSAPYMEGSLLIAHLKLQQESSSIVTTKDGVNASSAHNTGNNLNWHKKWVILNGHILKLYSDSKKNHSANSTGSPFHSINLTFACIKQINRTTIEIITTGSPSLSSSSSSSSDDTGTQIRFLVQLSSETEMKYWFQILQQSNQGTEEISSSTIDSSSKPKPRPKQASNTLLEVVRKQHESNSKCCDCNNIQSVEWISINLLCVLCIKCSGVHRSMGSHISKIRSLTLDNFTSPEILHLLRSNVSNANVNSIYESISSGDKITATSPDQERSQYITQKYQLKKNVDDNNQSPKSSIKFLIKAIHLNSIYLLQKCIAQSNDSLREVVQEQTNSRRDENFPTIFQYSLKHHEMVNGQPVFYITEFLLFNGISVDKLPRDTSAWSSSVIKYWNSKLDIYGTYRPIALQPENNQKSSFQSGEMSNRGSQLPNLTIPSDKIANKRWSLNPIPSTAQIMSPTNLLTMHKSLKLSKKGNTNHKE